MDARSLFFDHVLRRGARDAHAFEALCERHPAQREELQRLRAAFLKGRDVVARLERSHAGAPAAATEPPLHRGPLPVLDAAAVVERLRARGAEVPGAPSRAVERRGAGRPPSEVLVEARRLAHLDHPGIPSVHGLGLSADGSLVVATAVATGRPLGAADDEAPRVLERVREAAEVVAHAHARGVAHGSLDRERVVVDDAGAVTVDGWGAAGEATAERRAADVRALGRLLDALPPSARATRELRAIRDAATASKPLYETAGELAADLRALLEGRVVRADAGGPFTPLVKWARRNRPVAAGVLAFAAAAVVGFAAYADTVRDARDRALAARDEAAEQRERAEIAAAESVARLEELRLAALPDVVRALRAEADELWPVEPALAERLRTWLREARLVAERLPAVEERLARARAGAPEPGAPEPGAPEPGAHEHEELAPARALRERRRARHAELVAAGDTEAADVVARYLTWSEHEIAELEARPSPPAPLAAETAASEEERERLLWRGIRDAVLGFARGAPRHLEQAPRFGDDLPAIEARLRFAERLERLQAEERVRRAWDAAVALAADPDGPYAGLRLAPQPDLVPLGVDPESGLLELWHVPSGDEPRRDARGRHVLDEGSGVVLVLVPGGRFLQGAQSSDPRAPGFDPAATERDGPPVEVELDAFFLSKYELTQTQWLRATGGTPSHYKPGGFRVSWTNPVERVAHGEAQLVLARLGLELPTEAQWERAARAGSPGVPDVERTANVADRSFAELTKQDSAEAWDDGFVVHAPAGSFAPNAFGLHDTSGNVAEWCRDRYTRYDAAAARDGDGLREPAVDTGADASSVPGFVERGGSFLQRAGPADPRRRAWLSPASRTYYVGVRAARSLDLSKDARDG